MSDHGSPAPRVGDAGASPRVAVTIDVEEWFQVENLRAGIPRSEWDGMERRVHIGVEKALELLEGTGNRATFFCLGWLARDAPSLVRRIHRQGHEIASHGFWHELIGRQDRSEFREDVRSSKRVLEDLIGEPVLGYRAPNFSITDWAMEVLAEEGYRYDASYNSFSWHDRYGKLSGDGRGSWCGVRRHGSGLKEVPVFNFPVGPLRVPWGGGAYLRLMPGALFRGGLSVARRLASGEGVICLYLHGWELDPGQPRVRGISVPHRLRHYVGLEGTEAKLAEILRRFGSRPLRSLLGLEGVAE